MGWVLDLMSDILSGLANTPTTKIQDECQYGWNHFVRQCSIDFSNTNKIMLFRLKVPIEHSHAFNDWYDRRCWIKFVVPLDFQESIGYFLCYHSRLLEISYINRKCYILVTRCSVFPPTHVFLICVLSSFRKRQQGLYSEPYMFIVQG